MSPYLPIEGVGSRRVPGALTVLALKHATTCNLTNSTPTESSSTCENASHQWSGARASRTPCVRRRSAHNERKGGLEIQGAMGRRRAEETKLKSNSLTLRVFRRLRKEEI